VEQEECKRAKEEVEVLHCTRKSEKEMERE
jgi:hypothetical protein